MAAYCESRTPPGVSFLNMLPRNPYAALLLLAISPLYAQTGWFQPSLLTKPEVRKPCNRWTTAPPASSKSGSGWSRSRHPPARSRRARSTFVRRWRKLGLTDIRSDDMSNLSGVRKGTGGGPTVVFAAHMDTVFPEGTAIKVQRDGDILRAPGIGDDTSNLMATLEMFRALNRGGVKTKGDLIFLASVQEELGLLGAKHWLETSGYKPDMFVAVDLSSNQVWYGALRIDQFKFFLHRARRPHYGKPRRAEPGESCGEGDHCPVRNSAAARRRGPRQLQAARGERGDVRRRHRGQRRPARSMVHRRSALARQHNSGSPGERCGSTARQVGEQEGVGFRMERKMGIDYSKALPQKERLNHR